MSLDDELRARMKAAADQAGRNANPAAAAEYLATSKAATPPRTGPSLKLIAGLGGLSLVAGIGLGATLMRDGVDAAAGAATIDVSQGGVWDCPDGRIIDNLRSGDRVFVVGRDESGEWSAIRNPRSINDVVWLPDRALDADDGGSIGGDDVPVVPCATSALVGGSTTTTSSSTSTTSTSSTSSTSTSSTSSTSTTIPSSTTSAPTTTLVVVPGVTTTEPTPTTRPPTPTTAAPTTVAPTTAAPTTAAPTTVAPTTTTTVAPDTQNPTIQATSNRSDIYDSSWSANCDAVAQLTALASDNVGVTSVRATYSGLPNSPINLTFSNGAWRGNFGPFSGLALSFDQLITITLTARDAAGNQASTNVSVRVRGECLI